VDYVIDIQGTRFLEIAVLSPQPSQPRHRAIHRGATRALVRTAVGYQARPMLEIISRDPDLDLIASAGKLAVLGFDKIQTEVQETS
jgi:hypothetical protein